MEMDARNSWQEVRSKSGQRVQTTSNTADAAYFTDVSKGNSSRLTAHQCATDIRPVSRGSSRTAIPR